MVSFNLQALGLDDLVLKVASPSFPFPEEQLIRMDWLKPEFCMPW